MLQASLPPYTTRYGACATAPESFGSPTKSCISPHAPPARRPPAPHASTLRHAAVARHHCPVAESSASGTTTGDISPCLPHFCTRGAAAPPRAPLHCKNVHSMVLAMLRSIRWRPLFAAAQSRALPRPVCRPFRWRGLRSPTADGGVRRRLQRTAVGVVTGQPTAVGR